MHFDYFLLSILSERGGRENSPGRLPSMNKVVVLRLDRSVVLVAV